MTTDRTDFNETWLAEMPQRTVIADYYQNLVDSIHDLIKHGKIPQDIQPNIKKIVLRTVAYYWYQEDNIIQLAVELTKKPQAFQVRLIGKNPTLQGKPPYASDLYDVILNDAKQAIRIESDTLLTDEGFKIWQQLFKNGHKISVYDENNLGKSFQTLNSLEDFTKYFGGRDSRRYTFVLNESSFLAETRSFFNTRRIRELAGLNLED